MAGRDSAPCNPSMQAPKPACRRPNRHTGGQGWPWISNSPTCVLGLQLFTAMFILCNAGIRTRASCVLGMLDSQSTTVHIFKTKKNLKPHTSFDYVLILKDVQLRSLWPLSPVCAYTQPLYGPCSFLVPPCPLFPCSCSCDAHMASDLGLESWQLFSQSFTAADEYVSCSFTTSKNGKSHRPYP